MENNTSPIQPVPPTIDTPQPAVRQKSKIPLLVGGIVTLIVLLSAGTYLLFMNNQTDTQPTTPQKTSETSPTPEIINPKTDTPSEQITLPAGNIKQPTKNTSVLPNIKFTLPSGWTTNINDQSLVLIGPNTSSGHISIHAYDYEENVGRREFYCIATNSCTASTTFKETTIGNLQGYNALNLNIGGPQYFGAKGSVFYTIFVFNPPVEDAFEAEHKQVLGSLVF